jgi:choline dehydrogenase
VAQQLGAEYLKPARDRANLTVLTVPPVTRVVMEDRRATGIEFRLGNENRKVRVRREVVLAAGPLYRPSCWSSRG